MKNNIIRLTSNKTDIIIRCFPFVEILYWGHHLQMFTEKMINTLVRPIPNSRLDIDVPLTLIPENGRGLFSSPGIEGNRNSYDWSPVFETVDYVLQDNTLTINSIDKQTGLLVTSDMIIDKLSGVLKTRNSVKNIKDSEYRLERFAVTLPIPERANELMAFHGRWINEFQCHRLNLNHAGYIQENRRGRTSHEYFPGIICGRNGFTEQNSEVWGIHLAWSGNHRIRVDCKSDGRRQVQAESLYFSGEIVLQPEQSISTPWVYACYSQNGMNNMSQQFHNYIRSQITPSLAHKARPIHLNTWEGIYFNHDLAYLMNMASEAATLGIERFIIDDGWFDGRNGEASSLGDWYVDTIKYPQGLAPIISKVKSLGMEFGIWVEPEMINRDSKLYREHPDWVLALDEYHAIEGRNQLVLDLSNPNVYDYLISRLSWLLSEHDIDYIKWDFNREIVQPGHNGKAAIHNQTQILYRMLDELNEQFPHVEIESCASGGGRVDYEVLKRCHRFWPSDNNDALDRQHIQRGMSYFFPLEVMGTHIGAMKNKTTGRMLDLNFRGTTALFGHFGIELDPMKMSHDERKNLSCYIDIFKRFRPLIHTGDFFRVEHHDDSVLINMIADHSRENALIQINQLTLPTYALNGTVQIPYLTPTDSYSVEIIELPNNIKDIHNHVMKKSPHWFTHNVKVTGDWLMNAGLQLPILDPQSSMLIYLYKTESKRY